MIIKYKPINRNAITRSRRGKGHSKYVAVLFAFMKSDVAAGEIELDGADKKTMRSQLASTAKRHKLPLAVITGANGEVFLERTDKKD